MKNIWILVCCGTLANVLATKSILKTYPPDTRRSGLDSNYESVDSAPVYLCRKNSSDCVFLVGGTEKSEDVSVEGREISRSLAPEFSEESTVIRLHNGTVIGKKTMKDKSSLEHEQWTAEVYNSDELSNQLSKKILAIHTKEPFKDNMENDENISNQSRIIAYTIRPTLPTNGTSSSLASYPTITLAQLARQLIFPDWLWTRFASNRKTGLSDIKLSATKGATLPLVKPQLPSITFDNNFSRFLKLFTLVRFQNTACASPAGQNGTCYTSRECSDLGGTATSQCANGFGVCCIFQVRCGGRTSRNGTYFVDTGVTFAANQVQTCNVQILKTTPLIKQIRLDFQIFSLRQPVAGSCDIDRFVVSGQNTNNVIPILCGQNTGSHVYVETTESSGGIQLSVMTTGEGTRRWSIMITQYDTVNPNNAPSNCLQYYRGVMGSIQSFNYITDTSPQYLNNLNYAICIRREAGFCSVTYTNAGPDGTYQPFQIVNANAEGALVIPSGQAGVGYRDCPYDYILLNGFRLCGERLNDATTNILFVNDAPVTDTSNGPFVVIVRTNEIDVGGGFSLYYRQNPCMSTPG
ncbi:unnamed protein product [Allacma fusca]|uniref:CUB domain-containing protein n=1 Tax=Allacma fusca TaxID=39272 RepID=A0A8J2JM69_9HEXA|nr:unnamed protein product [Allacma fusca]